MVGIYSITNLINGKRYIGQSVNVEGRLYQHKWSLKRGEHYNRYLQRAFNKHGMESFSFDVLCECQEGELDGRERAWIDWFWTTEGSKGYNADSGGNVDKRRSEETRRKISQANMGRVISEETRRRMSESHMGNTTNVGRKASEETRRKMSQSLTGRSQSDSTKRKISGAMKGKPTWSKGKQLPEETKRKMSEAHMGHTFTDEARRKMSESHKARWAKIASSKQEGE